MPMSPKQPAGGALGLVRVNRCSLPGLWFRVVNGCLVGDLGGVPAICDAGQNRRLLHIGCGSPHKAHGPSSV